MMTYFRTIFLLFVLSLPIVSNSKGLGGAGAQIAVVAAKPVAKATGKAVTNGITVGIKQIPKTTKFSTKSLTISQRATWNNIPKHAGIYQFIDSNGKVYIGKSLDIHRRIGEHLRTGKLSPNGLANVKYNIIAPVRSNALPQEYKEYTNRLKSAETNYRLRIAERTQIRLQEVKDGRDSMSNIQIPRELPEKLIF